MTERGVIFQEDPEELKSRGVCGVYVETAGQHIVYDIDEIEGIERNPLTDSIRYCLNGDPSRAITATYKMSKATVTHLEGFPYEDPIQ